MVRERLWANARRSKASSGVVYRAKKVRCVWYRLSETVHNNETSVQHLLVQKVVFPFLTSNVFLICLEILLDLLFVQGLSNLKTLMTM